MPISRLLHNPFFNDLASPFPLDMHRIIALAFVAAAAAGVSPFAAAACGTDEDCGLLGDCVAGNCVCDDGWVGPTCASLDLQPAPPNSGLRQLNSSNWCVEAASCFTSSLPFLFFLSVFLC